MNGFINALFPIAILILGGYLLKRFHFLPQQSWPGIEKLTYFVLFPALLVATLGKQDLTGVPWTAMLAVVIGTLLSSAAVLVLWHRMTARVANPTFTSIFQGGVRFNTYIALAVAQAYYGQEGLALGSVAAGFLIIVINLLCVSAFAKWGSNAAAGKNSLIRELATNPLIIACVLGWALSSSPIQLPQIMQNTLEIIGRAALPLGLFAVGAALRPGLLTSHIPSLTVASLAQFGIKPVTALLLIAATGLEGVAAGVLLIAFLTPTAPSAYILARHLGGDTETMASIITLQTLLAFVVMPLIAWFLL